MPLYQLGDATGNSDAVLAIMDHYAPAGGLRLTLGVHSQWSSRYQRLGELRLGQSHAHDLVRFLQGKRSRLSVSGDRWEMELLGVRSSGYASISFTKSSGRVIRRFHVAQAEAEKVGDRLAADLGLDAVEVAVKVIKEPPQEPVEVAPSDDPYAAFASGAQQVLRRKP